jgi:ABC-2 type transport system permease protein
MHNFWLVAKQEFRTTVLRRSFLLLTLLVPVGLAVLVAFGYLVATSGESRLPIGYIDQAGIFPEGTTEGRSASGSVVARAYADDAAARAALERGEIQAYFILPPDYPTDLAIDVYYLEKPPSGDAWVAFDDFVRETLVTELPVPVQERLLQGPSVTVTDIVSGRQFGEDSIGTIIAPFVLAIFFFFGTLAAAQYMLSVVANEKENRTLEIMVTSVTPFQLIGGKTAALIVATLLQLALNVATVMLLLGVAGQFIPGIPAVPVPWGYLGLMTLYFLPSYALLAGVMIAIGSAVTGLEQGQQVAGLLNLVFGFPLYVIPVVFENPGHPLLVVLTLLPPTAFMSIALRWGLGTVPYWQMGLSWVLLVLAAGGMIWLAARVFRASMLRYGQRLTLKGIAAAIRRPGGP